MKLIVNPHKIEIIKEPVNEKEVNITKCEFEFADEITNEFAKEAYFTFKGDTYKVIILNNECDIPSEVLTEQGQVEIGVVAFKVDNELIRYNPSPAYFNTWIGSLKENAENSSTPTPSELEQIESILTNKQDNLVSGVNIKTINNQSLLGTGNITIEGGSGETTNVKINGVSITSNGIANIVTEGSYNSSTNKIATMNDLPSTSGFITKDVNDLTYYYTKTEVDGKVSSVYKYKGSVETYSGLPNSNLTVGDVYNVVENDNNYAWNGTEWDKLGGDIDLSGYQTKIDSTHKLSADLVDDTSTTNKFVTASDKTNWNAKGTYSKPSGGIPLSDLSSAVQTSLGKADTALQSETYTGTITSVKMNGSTISSSGEADLGTVLTQHQDISGKQDTLIAGTNISIASDGKTISATDTTYSDATTNASGLMSATDKTKLNGIASGAEVNVQSDWNEASSSSDAYIKNKPTIPTVNNSTITIQKNSTTVGSFTTNASSNKTINISVPTDTSDLTNGAGYTSNAGTITGITMNGASKGTSGIVDLGTVITSHQDISGKENTSNKVSSITSSSTNTQYAGAKAVYDLVDPVPSYVIEEAESTLSKAFSHRNLGRTIRFIAVSDAHNDEGSISHDYTQISNKHCGQAAKYISDRIGLDFVAFLGDGTWAGVATVDNYASQLKDDLQQMNEFLADGYRGIPNIRLVGNHDQIMTTDGYRIQNDGAYNYFGRYNAGNRVGNTNYGYYDIEDNKVRVIYLNTSDTTSTTTAGTLLAMSQEQKNWLCETLIDVNTKSDASSWKILLMSHAPLDMGVFDIANGLLLAYTNGGTYGSYTFTNHSAKILCNFHGHVHCYSYGYISDKIRRATIPNSNFYDNNHYKNNSSYAQWSDETTYAKTMNSRTDTAFSLVTIDLDNEICYIDNYGAGIDRTFSISYKKAVSSISNVSYSGITTVGSTIDTSAISYTLTYSDSSTATLTGGVSVSPITIANVGNNSVTVSYTEGGVTVSTTATIVGTAVPIVNLIDLNRTYETIPVDDSVASHLDETKGYKNIAYGTAKGYNTAKSCTVADVTSTGFTVTEGGVGGISVAIPIELDDVYKTHTITFDYSGAGKARTYYRFVKSADGSINASSSLYINDTAGASGTATVTIPDAYNKAGAGFDWLIIFFTSSTSATKSFTNVTLTTDNS